MALNCDINRDLIRRNLENHVAKLATNSAQFLRVGTDILVPAEKAKEISEKVLSYAEELPEFYKSLAKIDPVDFLRFVNDQVSNAPVSDSYNEGTGVDAFPLGLVTYAAKTLGKPSPLPNDEDQLSAEAQKKIEERFSPELSDNQGNIVNHINEAFEDNVVMPAGSVFKITIPERLVDEALKVTLKANPDRSERLVKAGSAYEAGFLYDQVGIAEGESVLDFVRKVSENKEQIEKFLKANPQITIQWGDFDSQFDPSINIVNISLPEAYEVYERTGVPLREVINFFIEHELAHAASYFALEKGKNDEFISDLLTEVKKYHAKIPFEDHLRQGAVEDIGLPYPMKDIHEFVADIFSNPYFQDYVKNVPYKGSTIWEKLINWLRGLIGLSPIETVYDKVVNYINSEKIAKDNAEGALTPWIQPLSIVYRGNPKNYLDATYDFFVKPEVSQQINAVIKNLPSAVIKLKQALSEENNSERRRKIQSLLDAYNEVKTNDKVVPVYINMLVTAAQVARDINEQLLAIPSLPEDKKVHVAYSLYISAKNLEFIVPLVNDVLRIMDTQGYGPDVARFVQQLRAITSVSQAVTQNFVNLTMPSVRGYYSSLNNQSTLYDELDKQRQEFRDKASTTGISANAKKLYEARANEIREKMTKIPSPQTFDKIFAGEYNDAVAAQMNLEAIYMNSHPLIMSVASKMRDLDIQISQELLSTENTHQKKLDKIVKDDKLSLRDPKKVWSDIYTTVNYVKEAKEDDNGNLIYTKVKTRMLLSEYSPEYLEKHFEFQSKRDFYYSKFLEAKRDSNKTNEDRYYALYTAAIKEQQVFQRENSELRYLPEVYAMFDLMDKDIDKGDGTTTTFRKERGNVFAELEELEHKRDSSSTMEDQKMIQDLIREKYIEMREIRSQYDKTGQLKTGFDLELSNIANQYYELRNKYGEYNLTPEGKASFQRTIDDINERYKNGYIGKDQKDALISENTVTELEQEYFDEMDRLHDLIQKATDEMMSIPEIADSLRVVNKDKVKEGYKKIRTLTSAFRDNEGIIDGILFSKVKGDLIKQIWEIQTETERLKDQASRLKGLSVQDSMRFRVLIDKQQSANITDEERQELIDLQTEKNSKGKIYSANKAIIDEYYDLLAELAKMTENTPSSYYLEEKDNQLNLLIQEERAQAAIEIAKSPVMENGTYYRKDDKWFKIQSKDAETGETVVTEITDDKLPDGKVYTAVEKIADEIAKKRADAKLVNTDWWKNHHYIRYAWDKEAKSYYPVETPIYIWVKTEPADKSYIKAGQPSLKFKTYKIHDGTKIGQPNYYNPNFREIHPWIPVNKKGKFDNADYAKLRDSNKSMFGYMEFLRKSYHDSQEMYPTNKRMGDLLPGIAKTNEEIRVDTTNKTFQLQTYKNLLKFIGKADESEDTKLLLGGSQSKYYSSKRILPTRFTDKLDVDTQSANIPGMILTFIQSATRYSKFIDVQPMLETTRIIVENLPVQEQANLASKFNLRSIFSFAKSDAKKLTREKQVDKTTLSKTLDYMLDTFVYQEAKDPSIISIAGSNLDLQKMSSNLKKLSSLSIFSLNMFSAIKNTGSAKVQGVINTHISKGFYTKTDLAKAQADAVKYVGSFWQDYKKFGDKSFIGQALQYFQVMHGSTYNEYGKKTQWTHMKNIENYLTWMKNSSEFELQVTQFLAMSRANKVQVGVDAEGKAIMVPMLEAFEINKDGNFAPKAGAVVTQEQINAFIKKISYINRLINGAYREDERNKFQKTVLGDLAFYLNGYIMPGITNRYAGTRYSIEADIITKGYWNQGYSFIKDLIKYRARLKTTWDTLSIEEKARVMRFIKELAIIVAFALLVGALGGGDDKDELRKNSSLHNYLLAQLMSIKSDTETFVPIPGMGLNELARKMNSPFVALKQVTNILKVIQNGLGYVVGNSDAFYKRDGVGDGFHDEGDPKVVANFLRLIGWTGTAFDPLEKLTRVKQLQELK